MAQKLVGREGLKVANLATRGSGRTLPLQVLEVKAHGRVIFSRVVGRN